MVLMVPAHFGNKLACSMLFKQTHTVIMLPSVCPSTRPFIHKLTTQRQSFIHSFGHIWISVSLSFVLAYRKQQAVVSHTTDFLCTQGHRRFFFVRVMMSGLCLINYYAMYVIHGLGPAEDGKGQRGDLDGKLSLLLYI